VIGYLFSKPSKLESLSSHPSTTKKIIIITRENKTNAEYWNMRSKADSKRELRPEYNHAQSSNDSVSVGPCI
jgi:hypothetical protein